MSATDGSENERKSHYGKILNPFKKRTAKLENEKSKTKEKILSQVSKPGGHSHDSKTGRINQTLKCYAEHSELIRKIEQKPQAVLDENGSQKSSRGGPKMATESEHVESSESEKKGGHGRSWESNCSEDTECSDVEEESDQANLLSFDQLLLLDPFSS